MSSAIAPHTAVLNVHVHVYGQLPSGELDGKPISAEELAQVGIKPKFLLSVNGFDRFECLKKLKEKLEAFNNG